MRLRQRLHAAAGALLGLASCAAVAAPFLPADDAAVLADVPPGTKHAELATRQLARSRIEIGLPLAQIYIRQARSSGDLRYLGYADAVLEPWVGPTGTSPDALVLHATILQSRHDFSGALSVLERARVLRPDDAQAWLTTATVLRVMGRYDQSAAACDRLQQQATQMVTELCRQSIRGLSGNLGSAYRRVARISPEGSPDDECAWRDSELAEMAVRMGNARAAESWFTSGLRLAPDDFYLLGAYADLLLREQRPHEVLGLLKGKDTLEPLLLRLAIAQRVLHEPSLSQSIARLAAAFGAETQRGEGIHLREEARFLLEVQGNPRAALAAAQENWKVQREPEDVLVLVQAAKAAREPETAAPALAFVREHGLEDVRLTRLLEPDR